MGVQPPSPSSSYVNTKVMDGSKKIPISLAFFKLVLDDVKVEILLISLHFLVAPPPAH